jgi:hypothetical protein
VHTKVAVGDVYKIRVGFANGVESQSSWHIEKVNTSLHAVNKTVHFADHMISNVWGLCR